MDNSFLKFYKNDFNQAVVNENNANTITQFSGYVQMLTNETFLQITNCSKNIAFEETF